jgi:hypothetical protein
MTARETTLGMRDTRSETARPAQHFYEEVTRLLPPKKDCVPPHRNCYTNYWGGYVFLLFQVF